MCIIQFGSTDVALILKQEIKYLLTDIVSIGRDFFFYREVHNSISFVLDRDKSFIALVSAWLSIVGAMSLESVLQNSFSPEILYNSSEDIFSVDPLILFKRIY